MCDWGTGRETGPTAAEMKLHLTHNSYQNIMKKLLILPFFLSYSDLLPTRCRCKGLLVHLITLTARTHTHGRTPLDEGSARGRDLRVTTHNTHNRQTSTPPAGFEPTMPARERPTARPPGSAETESKKSNRRGR